MAASNAKMHARNPFLVRPPDFYELSQLYAELQPHCKNTASPSATQTTKCSIDFRDAQALATLARVLLKHYFACRPQSRYADHLIPRVPQRVNYVLWIEDLLGRPTEASGIDIGCGVTCIYALLACSLNKSWKMMVTDVSDETIRLANSNIQANNLQERISVLKSGGDSSSILLDLIQQSQADFDFVMCNPPFYSSFEDYEASFSSAHRPKPKSINTGKAHEIIYEDGGEVGFVTKMVDESLRTGKKVKVYTTMFGKKSSFVTIKKYLRAQKEVQSMAQAEFYQGRTLRWALAWTFHGTEEFKFPPPPLPQTEQTETKGVKHGDKSVSVSLELPSTLYQDDQYNPAFIYQQAKDCLTNQLQFELLGENESKSEATFVVKSLSWQNQRAKRRRAKFSRNPEPDEEVATPKLESSEDLKDPFRLELTVDTTDSSQKIFLGLKACRTEATENLAELKVYLNQLVQFYRNRLAQKD